MEKMWKKGEKGEGENEARRLFSTPSCYQSGLVRFICLFPIAKKEKNKHQ
jgi:hypothetical protein